MDFRGPDSNHRVLAGLAIIFLTGVESGAARAAHVHPSVLRTDAIYTGRAAANAANVARPRDAHRKSTTVPDQAQWITLAAGFSLIGIAVGVRRRHLAAGKGN